VGIGSAYQLERGERERERERAWVSNGRLLLSYSHNIRERERKKYSQHPLLSSLSLSLFSPLSLFSHLSQLNKTLFGDALLKNLYVMSSNTFLTCYISILKELTWTCEKPVFKSRYLIDS